MPFDWACQDLTGPQACSGRGGPVWGRGWRRKGKAAGRAAGESVSVKKAGATYKGLCPFHGEKTPSFVVTPHRESWHCFGCGLGGDIFSFVMQRDSVTFPEAIRTLATRAGVEIDERTKREDAHRARLP